MGQRHILLGGVGALAGLVALALGVRAWDGGFGLAPVAGYEAEADEPLPLPPVPPRVAEGPDYERCLSMLNSDPAGARNFAEAWFATGGGEGAEHCSGLALVALGEPDAGAAALDKLAARSKATAGARAAVYGQAGQAWLMASDPSRALGSTTLALSMTPDDADLLIDRSIASGTLERYQDAVEDLSRALELDPRRADALVFRAAAQRHLNRLELAQEDVDRAFALDPEDADALLERGILRQRRGDRMGARADWEHAKQLSPDSATGELAEQNLALLDAGPDRR